MCVPSGCGVATRAPSGMTVCRAWWCTNYGEGFCRARAKCFWGRYTPAAFAECETLAYHSAHETFLASSCDHLHLSTRANLKGGVFSDNFRRGKQGARRTNGVGGERLCGCRAHDFLCACIKRRVAHAEVESAHVPVVSLENNYGARRVAHEAARSWVRGDKMGPMGSARRTLTRSERPLRSTLA